MTSAKAPSLTQLPGPALSCAFCMAWHGMARHGCLVCLVLLPGTRPCKGVILLTMLTTRYLGQYQSITQRVSDTVAAWQGTPQRSPALKVTSQKYSIIIVHVVRHTSERRRPSRNETGTCLDYSLTFFSLCRIEVSFTRFYPPGARQIARVKRPPCLALRRRKTQLPKKLFLSPSLALVVHG